MLKCKFNVISENIFILSNGFLPSRPCLKKWYEKLYQT